MKKIITNAPCALAAYLVQKLKENPAQLKEKAEDILKFVQEKVQQLAHDEFYTKWKGDKNLQDFQ